MLAIAQPQGGCGIEMTGVRLAEHALLLWSVAEDRVQGSPDQVVDGSDALGIEVIVIAADLGAPRL
ncbi:MAG: hypothetical protein ACKOZX_12450, partial [Gammaproteobacteria bacterium]